MGPARAARAGIFISLVGTLLFLSGEACKMQEDASSRDSQGTSATAASATVAARVSGAHGVRFVAAPAPATPEDVTRLVRSETAKASAEGRTLLVYVGATWCEPCIRFHGAAQRGELDTDLAGFTFLEFDLDRDRDRIVDAGYTSHFIPLFAVPGPDGRGNGKQIEGSVKGEEAVREITPRLRALVGK
jgi:thiol-disulfide isomerase/thioredoxin